MLSGAMGSLPTHPACLEADMPILMCLLCVTTPIVAALSLDIAVLVPFLILFCVAAALITPTAGEGESPRKDERIRFDRVVDNVDFHSGLDERNRRRNALSEAGGNDAPRPLEFLRF